MAVWVFDVPHKGDFLFLTLAAFLYVTFATGFGLLVSVFTRSQVAAIFATFLALIAVGSVFFILALIRFRKTIGSMV